MERRGRGAPLLLVIRPLMAAVALTPARGTRLEKGAIAAFGIRGMSSVCLLAFAQGRAA